MEMKATNAGLVRGGVMALLACGATLAPVSLPRASPPREETKAPVEQAVGKPAKPEAAKTKDDAPPIGTTWLLKVTAYRLPGHP
jgi:hypothetical protein